MEKEKYLDIYFDKNYGKLYENIENGKAEIFEYEDENGKISNQFIIREIPIKLDENSYFDIVTPYGYGGPVIEECALGKEKQLVESFAKEFEKYCEKNRIVSEFVRFHPLINNAKDFKEVYNAECIRKTLGTNLKKFDEPVQAEFSKSCRKNIRQAINKGITYKITQAPENIHNFKEIYYSTMDRNNATDYYYFDDKYFNSILKYFKKNVLLVEAIFENKAIAAGLYFIYNKTIHIHLSGTLRDYLYLSPAYILRYAATLWGKENGYEMIHHGGGRSNSVEDTLYKFKKGFAKNTEFDFFIGKKIWNEEIYKELCRMKQIDLNEEFFPAYRKDLN